MGTASVWAPGPAPVIDSVLLHGLLGEVKDEIVRAGLKHGPESMAAPGHGLGKRLGILGEEFGEVCRATTYDNGSAENLREELVQTAAMAVAWLHALELEGNLLYDND